jgi:hypothetical protein
MIDFEIAYNGIPELCLNVKEYNVKEYNEKNEPNSAMIENSVIAIGLFAQLGKVSFCLHYVSERKRESVCVKERKESNDNNDTR